jgi:hypothetical protein
MPFFEQFPDFVLAHRRDARVPEWPAGFGASDTRSCDARAHALLYERALELGEDAQHLEHRSPGWRRCVEPLALKIEVAADSVQLVEETDEILQRSTEAIDGPSRNHVDLALGHCLEELVEGGALVAPLGSRYALVGKLAGDDPAAPRSREGERSRNRTDEAGPMPTTDRSDQG